MTQREWIEKDFYATLGVSKGASQAEIRSKYRKLAQEYHPDNNPDDPAAEEKFKEVSQAYDVIGDPKKRKEYDQMRDMLSSGFGRFTSGEQEVRFEDINDFFGGRGGGGFGGSGIDDMLANLFGTSRQRSAVRGQDLESEITISFEEALEGVTTSLQLADQSGRSRTVKARIPAGVSNGARIRLPGKGAPGQGGPAGDLYIKVNVESHPLFGRKGKDLTLDLPITFTEAAMGAEVAVPTLNGDVTVKIPPGTQPGKVLRIRGKGASTNGVKSDLLIKLNVAVPNKLTREQKKILSEFSKTERAPREHIMRGESRGT